MVATMDFQGLKARDMERLAGNPTSDVAGFQPSIFMVMPEMRRMPIVS